MGFLEMSVFKNRSLLKTVSRHLKKILVCYLEKKLEPEMSINFFLVHIWETEFKGSKWLICDHRVNSWHRTRMHLSGPDLQISPSTKHFTSTMINIGKSWELEEVGGKCKLPLEYFSRTFVIEMVYSEDNFKQLHC